MNGLQSLDLGQLDKLAEQAGTLSRNPAAPRHVGRPMCCPSAERTTSTTTPPMRSTSYCAAAARSGSVTRTTR